MIILNQPIEVLIKKYPQLVEMLSDAKVIEGEFERLSDDVILIDGKHYSEMGDDEVVKYIWGSNQSAQQRNAGELLPV